MATKLEADIDPTRAHHAERNHEPDRHRPPQADHVGGRQATDEWEDAHPSCWDQSGAAADAFRPKRKMLGWKGGGKTHRKETIPKKGKNDTNGKERKVKETANRLRRRRVQRI